MLLLFAYVPLLLLLLLMLLLIDNHAFLFKILEPLRKEVSHLGPLGSKVGL